MDNTALSLGLSAAGGCGGGWLFAVLRYRIQRRAADKIDFDAVLKALQGQRDEAWAQIDRQEKRIEHLEAEINGLRIARDLDPFPHWLVDIQGRCSFVNRPFEEHFLAPQRQTHRDAIGKTQDELWPDEFGKRLKALDASARKRPDGTARANTLLDIPSLGPCEVTIHKFPCKIQGVIVAYAGYITAMDPVDEKIGWPRETSP